MVLSITEIGWLTLVVLLVFSVAASWLSVRKKKVYDHSVSEIVAVSDLQKWAKEQLAILPLSRVTKTNNRKALYSYGE